MSDKWVQTIIYDDFVVYDYTPKIPYALYIHDSPYFGISWGVCNDCVSLTDPIREGPAETIEQAKQLAEGAYIALSTR